MTDPDGLSGVSPQALSRWHAIIKPIGTGDGGLAIEVRGRDCTARIEVDADGTAELMVFENNKLALRKAHAERIREARVGYYQRNPEKEKARRVLNAAVKTGAVARGACEVCGSHNAEGHHADYSKPLDVRWLCPLHHAQEEARNSPLEK